MYNIFNSPESKRLTTRRGRVAKISSLRCPSSRLATWNRVITYSESSKRHPSVFVSWLIKVIIRNAHLSGKEASSNCSSSRRHYWFIRTTLVITTASQSPLLPTEVGYIPWAIKLRHYFSRFSRYRRVSKFRTSPHCDSTLGETKNNTKPI